MNGLDLVLKNELRLKEEVVERIKLNAETATIEEMRDLIAIRDERDKRIKEMREHLNLNKLTSKEEEV